MREERMSTHERQGSGANTHGNHWYEKEENQFAAISEKELELGECLGSGSFGQVYKAKYKGKWVAVKFVNLSKKKEFEAELRALTGVNHPNIIRLYGANIAPPRFHLVMELGQTSLHNYIREHSYEMLDVYKWALQITEGMGYLHTKSIVHRDLKTANILLDSRNHVKICDFGTARDFSSTMAMTFVGTISYMAPELLKEQPVSEKIDVYSFAIVLWEMITGKFPFANMKPVQIMWLVAQEQMRLPILEDTPKLFKMTIESAWKQDPKERPSFKTILGTFMSAIGTDLEIKSEMYLKPLQQTQTQWGESIDKTLEGYKTVQMAREFMQENLQRKSQELAQKEAQMIKKEADLAQREMDLVEEDDVEDNSSIIRRAKSCPPVRRQKGREQRLSTLNKINQEQRSNIQLSPLSPPESDRTITKRPSQPNGLAKTASLGASPSENLLLPQITNGHSREVSAESSVSDFTHSRDVSADFSENGHSRDASVDYGYVGYAAHSRDASTDFDQSSASHSAEPSRDVSEELTGSNLRTVPSITLNVVVNEQALTEQDLEEQVEGKSGYMGSLDSIIIVDDSADFPVDEDANLNNNETPTNIVLPTLPLTVSADTS